MVGIDILSHVADNVLEVSTDEREKVEYSLPQWVKDMISAKWPYIRAPIR